jgi:hypothetical protein
MNPRVIATALALVLGCAQSCFASEARQQAAEGFWNTLGNKLKLEVASLPEPGRRAFRDALLACTLYLDEPSNRARKDECSRTERLFAIEYTSGSSLIHSTFGLATTNAAIQTMNVTLELQQGKPHDLKFDDLGYAYLDVLQRAYRETGKKPPGSGSLSDAQIAAVLVKQSREAYYASGHPCACPDDLARDGSHCGGRSAASRPGGASPYCYPSQVPISEIEAYRARH